VLRLLGDIAAGATPSVAQEARDRYGEALERASRFQARPLVAHCHLGLGKVSRRIGKRE